MEYYLQARHEKIACKLDKAKNFRIMIQKRRLIFEPALLII